MSDTRTARPVEADEAVRLRYLEAPAARRARLSSGALLTALGVSFLVLGLRVQGDARFALSTPFDAVQLPTVALPSTLTVVASALVTLAAGVGFLTGRVPPRAAGWVSAAAGVAVFLGFVSWAAAGAAYPFPVGNQLSGTVALATPLVLGALGGVLCENSGVVNVAIEGQFLVAALTAATVGSVTGSIGLALVAAALAGVAMGALLALFALKYLVDQVVLGVVLNLLATGVTGFLFDQLIQPNSAALNDAPSMGNLRIPLLADIPLLGPALFDQKILAYLAVLSVVGVTFLLYRTRWGLRVRSVGEHPHAADTVGISVRAIRWQAVLLGGVFAGLGGAFFTIGSTGGFIKDITVGNGFIALAALIMGRWHPVRAALMAVFFGFVTQLASQMQTLQTPMPSQFLLMLPYLATIIAVAGLIGRVRAPAADGVPYTK